MNTPPPLPSCYVTAEPQKSPPSVVVAAVVAGGSGLFAAIVFTVIGRQLHHCLIWPACTINAAIASAVAVSLGAWLLFLTRKVAFRWVLIALAVMVSAISITHSGARAPRGLFEQCILEPMPASVTIHQANWFFSCPPGVWIHFSASPETVADIIRERQLEVVPANEDGEISTLKRWQSRWRHRADWWTPCDMGGRVLFARQHGGVQPWREDLWVNSSSNECLATVW